ncbi:TPA: hypothetical protein L4V19_001991 [Pseudomonas aeruginosa]|nr:hypothetical protein [Pseudomonas aeruginosa]
MKERPILFSGPMVRAILEGRKTVTRRAVKDTGFYAIDAAIHGNEVALREREALSTRCPFGQPGDRLWVREAWAQINVAQAPGETWVVYRECDNRTDYGGPWKPSIHMRRRDSRILLEITAVRVERLQDITEDQAIAEGIDTHPMGFYGNGCITAGGAFLELWESINGDGSWAANPWVWVIEFKRVTP